MNGTSRARTSSVAGPERWRPQRRRRRHPRRAIQYPADGHQAERKTRRSIKTVPKRSRSAAADARHMKRRETRLIDTLFIVRGGGGAVPLSRKGGAGNGVRAVSVVRRHRRHRESESETFTAPGEGREGERDLMNTAGKGKCSML